MPIAQQILLSLAVIVYRFLFRCRLRFSVMPHFWMRSFVHRPWQGTIVVSCQKPILPFPQATPKVRLLGRGKGCSHSLLRKQRIKTPLQFGYSSYTSSSSTSSSSCSFSHLNSMDFGPFFYALIGFSMSVSLCLPNLKKWQSQQITAEKLRIISEALEHAEERAIRFQERHDRVLSQICSYYLCHQELREALAVSQITMNEALGFAVGLRKMQMEILCSYPDEVDGLILRRLPENTGSGSGSGSGSATPRNC